MKTIILLILLIMFSVQNLMAAECMYRAKQSTENPYPEFLFQGDCGILTEDDSFKLYQNHLTRLMFKENGLAAVFVEKKFFYILKDGTSARTAVFDNGPDYFAQGLTRTISKGKYGFMDKNLHVVIKPVYDFVFPFNNGLAVVCNGCNSVLDGEHQQVSGGKWGAVNKKGEIIYDLMYTKDKLYKKMMNKAE